MNTVYSYRLYSGIKAVFFILFLLIANYSFGTTYYSDSGNSDPNNLNYWWTATNNTGTHPADFITDNDEFVVQAGHTYTTTAIWNISDPGQTVTVNGTLTYAHASSITNLTLGAAGTVNANAQNTISGTWTMVAGSVYNFNHTTTSNTTTTFAGTESFNANAIIKFSSFETTAHAFEDCCNVCTGGFPSVTWDMTGQSTDIDWANNPFTIAGNFIMSSTGAGANYVYISNATDDNLTVNGNFTMSGGKLMLTKTGSGGSHDMYVGGNFSMSAGTIDFEDASLSPVLYVTGNFSHTGGTLTETGGGSGNITLNGTSGTQTLESTGTSNLIYWTVAGSNAQCNVASSKTFVLSASATFTVSAGTATPDLLVDGTFTRNGGTFTLTGTGTIGASGTYTHNVNNLALPGFSWTAGSLCNVTGVTSNNLSGTRNATFSNFTWNCASQSGTIDLLESQTSGTFTVNSTFTIVNTNSQLLVAGGGGSGSGTITAATLDMQGGSLSFNNNAQAIAVNITTVTQSSGTINWDAGGTTSPNTISISGNMTVSGGTSKVSSSTNNTSFTVSGNLLVSSTGTFNGAGSTGDPTINITGNLTTSGTATFYGTVNSGGIPTFNIQGAVDLSTGTTGSSSASLIGTNLGTYNLTGAGSNTLTLKTGLAAATTANWTWTISAGRTITLGSNVEIGGNNVCSFTNNGILIMGTYIISDATGATSPDFTNASGATLKTANTAGISTTAATGTIQTTGTNTYSSAASYVYNGSSAQVTGNFGASTTPTASTVANLEFNNSAGVTLTAGLTVANSGTLTLTAGYHDLATYTLQLGTSAATTLTRTAGGLYSATDNGSFKRWIPATTVTSTDGNYYGLFPFAEFSYRSSIVELNTTADVTTGGFISATPEFANSTVDVNYDDDQPSNVDYINNGRAVTFTLTTIAGGTFNLKISYLTIEPTGNASDLTLVTYTGAAMGHQGTYVANSGTKTAPVIARTGIATANLANRFVIGTYNNGASPLPVSLLSFDGQPKENSVELTWVTATETNNDYFTIERSEDGKNFKTINQTDGAGNSAAILNYSIFDQDPLPGISYYRLKQTDFDGRFSYSDIRAVTINSVLNINEFNVYPNPAIDSKFTISFGSHEHGQIELYIYNCTGDLLEKKQININKGENAINMEVKDKSPGLYFIELRNSDTRIKTYAITL